MTRGRARQKAAQMDDPGLQGMFDFFEALVNTTDFGIKRKNPDDWTSEEIRERMDKIGKLLRGERYRTGE